MPGMSYGAADERRSGCCSLLRKTPFGSMADLSSLHLFFCRAWCPWCRGAGKSASSAGGEGSRQATQCVVLARSDEWVLEDNRYAVVHRLWRSRSVDVRGPTRQRTWWREGGREGGGSGASPLLFGAWDSVSVCGPVGWFWGAPHVHRRRRPTRLAVHVCLRAAGMRMLLPNDRLSWPCRLLASSSKLFIIGPCVVLMAFVVYPSLFKLCALHGGPRISCLAERQTVAGPGVSRR